MLTRAHRQEALSRAYVQAIAARCGLICSDRDYDYGVDIGLHEVQQRGNRYVESGFHLNVQVKSSTAVIWTESHVQYDLDSRNYNDLQDPDFSDYRILVLLVQPEDELTWTDQTEEGLTIRTCAYWLSLRGAAPTENRSTIRIAIPRTNVFSIVALRGLMEKIRKGEPL